LKTILSQVACEVKKIPLVYPGDQLRIVMLREWL
jgi:hypothetical protein